MLIADAGSNRIPALDFTKGALVLIMVLYHWLNYFVSTEGSFYTYLRFLTPSFIFITGFLISQVYLVSYQTAGARVPRRLVQRGLKILAVFLLLNVVRIFLVPDARSDLMPSDAWSGEHLIATFVTGNVGEDGRAAAFNILVPISYLLLLSAPLVSLSKLYKYSFHAACFFCLLCILILRLRGLQYGSLELLTVGLLGVIVGYIPIARISAFLKHRYLLAVAYLCYLGALSVWGATYPLQIVGVLLSLMIIYVLGEQGQRGWLRACTILLGRYSLFGYIAQIAILQGLYRAFQHADLGAATLSVSFVAAFVLTILAVVIVDRARAKVRTVDRLYKAVFA